MTQKVKFIGKNVFFATNTIHIYCFQTFCKLRMVSTHIFFICPTTYTNFSVKLFIASPINNKKFSIELPILTADLWSIKVNLPLTHSVAQLGKMCQGISYMADNQYSSLAWLLVTMKLIEREVSHRICNLLSEVAI